MKKLHDIRNHFYDRSEKLWFYSLLVMFFAQFLGSLSTIFKCELFVLFAGLMVLLSPIIIVILREIAAGFSNRADQCRRMILYSDGLGIKVSRESLMLVDSWGLGEVAKDAPFEEPYYDSKCNPGPRRLADITAESAFFTSQLAEKSAVRIFWALVVTTLFLIAALYLIVSSVNSNVKGFITVSKSMMSLIIFILTGDLLLLFKKYKDLKKAAEDTLRECVRLRNRKRPAISEVFRVVEEYHLKLVQSPPIPTQMHLKYHNGLNEIYRKHHSSGQ